MSVPRRTPLSPSHHTGVALGSQGGRPAQIDHRAVTRRNVWRVTNEIATTAASTSSQSGALVRHSVGGDPTRTSKGPQRVSSTLWMRHEARMFDPRAAGRDTLRHYDTEAVDASFEGHKKLAERPAANLDGHGLEVRPDAWRPLEEPLLCGAHPSWDNGGEWRREYPQSAPGRRVERASGLRP